MKKVLLIALSAALCVSAAMAQTSVKALEKQAGNGDTGAMVAAATLISKAMAPQRCKESREMV